MLNKKPNHRRTFARHHPAMKIACIYNITYVAAVIARALILKSAKTARKHSQKSPWPRSKHFYIYICYIYDKLWISKAVAGKVSHIHTLSKCLWRRIKRQWQMLHVHARAHTPFVYIHHTQRKVKSKAARCRAIAVAIRMSSSYLPRVLARGEKIVGNARESKESATQFERRSVASESGYRCAWWLRLSREGRWFVIDKCCYVDVLLFGVNFLEERVALRCATIFDHFEKLLYYF